MGKIKKALIGALLTCAAVCVSTAAAACNKNADYSKYPAYREPAGYVPPEGGGEQGDPDVYNGVYTVKINSMGGLKLNGVRVNALKNGAVVMSGISIDGIVEFGLDKGVYDIEIDASSLPDGYYLDDKAYATEADKAVVNVGVPSRVISTTASSGTSYQVGDIMYDFAYNEVGGARRTLSGLFADTNIKAVVLNFFFTTCGPCQAEFPAIEGAFEAYKDKLALVALSNQDSVTDIRNFKETRGLTFDMAYDGAGVTNMFGINNFPTTIIVDRYGAVAYRSMGTLPNEAVWKGLFNTYTSDDYVQKDNDDEEDLPTERVKPDEGLTMPASSEIETAINGTGTAGKLNNYRPETNENDAPYSWPWVLEEENGSKYLTASNSKKGYSFAIVYSTITLNSGEALSYEYNVDTETDCDFLYTLLNGTIVGTHSGNSGGWQEAKAVYVADHTVTLDFSFIYIKDQQKDEGADKASIRNITIRPITEIDLGKAIDQRTAAVDGLTLNADNEYVKNGQNFEVGYITKPTSDDDYYYITYKDLATGRDQKALLLADFNFSTLWAEKHLKSTKFVSESSSLNDATLYNLSFWRLSNYDRPNPETTPLKFDYGHSEYLIESYYLQDFSDNKLLPVNNERKAIIEDFIKEFYDKQKSLLKDGDAYYEDQWLEFCYYYMHFGGSHGNGEEDFCFKTDNPILGLTFENALTAVEGVNYANVRKMLNLSDGGGLKFIFKPTKTGIYLFSSEALEEAVNPRIIVMDENDRVLAEQDDDVRLGHFGASEFYKYVYLEAGKTYHVQAAMHYALDTGKYNFTIEFTGKTYLQTLRTCSTADGMWTYDPDNTSFEYYLAIPVALNGNYYYEVTKDYNYGSPIYIDFVHVNYFDQNGHTLLEMVENGIFNFGVVDYTAQMLEYYYKAIENEGELHGLVKADKKLVNMLNTLIRTTHGNGPESNAWQMFAYYYESVGNPS